MLITIKSFAFPLIIFGTLLASAFDTLAKCGDLDPSIEQKIDALLQNMSLDEKVAQMRVFHSNNQMRALQSGKAVELDPDGKLIIPASLRERFKFGIGGAKNPGETISPLRSAILTNKLQKEIINSSPNKIPALFIAEAYNGLDAHGSTQFSRPINMASTWNTQLIHDVWDVIGREARLRGFHMLHSPVADIHRDPRFGRMSEGFGEDTHLTKVMAYAAITGAQGDQHGLKTTHVGTVTKHFVGYGQVDGGKNFASINISERELVDEILPPFYTAVTEACTLGIMPSHGDINGIASHGNKALLTDLLKETWGFNGYVVSDAEDIARLGFFMRVAETEDDAALLGLRAGVDIDLYSDHAYALLPSLAKKNPTILPLINESVRRILRAKYKLGLFENPYVAPEIADKGTRTERALELVHKLNIESAILLKNENKLLPLNVDDYKDIALIGPLVGARTKTDFETVFGGRVNLNVATGIRLTNTDVVAPQLVPFSENKAAINRAIKAAKKSDLVIMFLGDTELTSKEAFFRGDTRGDRSELTPVAPQNALVNEIFKLGKPIVVVLKQRRALSISEINDKSNAILNVWEQGEGGDLATAQILAGQAAPAGRLPVSIPYSVGSLPAFYSQKHINYKKGYLFDRQDGALFPFGFGMTYTDFSYSDLTLSSKTLRSNDSIRATIKIKNIGNRPGHEVVQLYISDTFADVIRPIKELKAFKKIHLVDGETQDVTFEITPEMLVHTGIDMRPDPGYGEFKIEVAPSSAGGGLSVTAANKK